MPRNWVGCLFKSHPEACMLVTQHDTSLRELGQGKAGWSSISLSLQLLARQWWVLGSLWISENGNQVTKMVGFRMPAFSYGLSLLSSSVKKLQMNWANPNLDYNWGNSAIIEDSTRILPGFREDGKQWLWVHREWFVTTHLSKRSLCASSQESKICSLYFHKSYVISDNKIK